MRRDKNNDNDSAFSELAECVARDKPVLMVGAGLSKLVGYPLWKDLMHELREKLQSTVAENHEYLHAKDYARYVDEILKYAPRGRADLAPFLMKQFGPDAVGQDYDQDIHLGLMRLPFCGIFTTNYDRVLEDAAHKHLQDDRESVSREFTQGLREIRVHHRDLCHSGHKIFILDLIRRLARNEALPCRDEILHLHGYYENAGHIVLGHEDYANSYGPLLGDNQNVLLDSDILHPHVIWSLLVSHPWVFIGFGMSDPFFMQIQRVIKSQFAFGSAIIQPRHFAVLEEGELTGKLRASLIDIGILPVSYRLDVNANDPYRKALKTFVRSLQSSVDLVTQSTTSDDSGPTRPMNNLTSTDDEVSAQTISKRMLAKL